MSTTTGRNSAPPPPENDLTESLQHLETEIKKHRVTFEKQYSTRLANLEKNISSLQKTISNLEERQQSSAATSKSDMAQQSYSTVSVYWAVIFLGVAILVFAIQGELVQLYEHITFIQTECRKVYVYHWETLVPIETNSKNCSASISYFKQLANKAFPRDPIITQLVTFEGEDVADVVDFKVTEENSGPLRFVALAEGEKFIFPAEFLNKIVYRKLGEPHAPYTVGIRPISKEPRLLELTDLLSEEESDHFLEIAKNLEKQESQVGADTESATKSLSRSSSHSWLGREANGASDRWYTDAVIDRVEERIFELTRLDTTTVEPFQVVFYQKDQYYYGHHDYSTKSGTLNNPYYQGGGNRLVTILIYLNDVESGGETSFPFVNEFGQPINHNITPTDLYEGAKACTSGGIKVKPKKGSALMFYNLKEKGHMDGVVDQWSLHAGCTVLKGEKYVTNKWIRNKRVNGKLYDSYW